MPRKPKEVEPDEDEEDDEEEEDEEEDEDEEDDDEADAARDHVIARLAAARSSVQATLESIDDAIALFMSPEDDTKGKKRVEAIDTALEASGLTSRALEESRKGMKDVDPSLGEPWEDED